MSVAVGTNVDPRPLWKRLMEEAPDLLGPDFVPPPEYAPEDKQVDVAAELKRRAEEKQTVAVNEQLEARLKRLEKAFDNVAAKVDELEAVNADWQVKMSMYEALLGIAHPQVQTSVST